MLRKDHLTPRPHLSAKANELWNKLYCEYDLSNTAARVLLEGALTSYDRAAEARGIIKKEGGTYETVSGKSTRIQPAASSDAWETMARRLRHLNLDLQPLADRPGRQAGDRENQHANYPP